jgi:hypothetical protein
MQEGRGLVIAIRDLRLVFSEPVARWLLAMLSAILAVESELGALRQPAAGWPRRALAGDVPAVRIQVVVQVYHSGELGRPRWDGTELVVTAGDLVLRFSERAARGLLGALMGFLASELDAAAQAHQLAGHGQ